MGTNTKNGIRIFGITIWIYSINRSVGSGDRFSVRALDISGYWYSTRSSGGADSSIWGFYELFRFMLLIYGKMFLDQL